MYGRGLSRTSLTDGVYFVSLLTLTTRSTEGFGRGRTLSLSLLLSTTAMSHSRAARESSGATCEKQPTLRGALLLRLRALLLSPPAHRHRRKKGHCTLSLFSLCCPYVTSPLSLHSKVHGTTGREGRALAAVSLWSALTKLLNWSFCR